MVLPGMKKKEAKSVPVPRAPVEAEEVPEPSEEDETQESEEEFEEEPSQPELNPTEQVLVDHETRLRNIEAALFRMKSSL